MSKVRGHGFERETISMEPIDEKRNDLYLIRVPKGFDINKLNGVQYSPPGTVQIETEKGRRGIVSVVELGSHGETTLDVNLLVKSDDKKAVAGPSISQSLCVSRLVHLKAKSPSKRREVGNSSPVPMPPGLKPRFTPFGAASPISTPTNKKKKKKKAKRKSELDESALDDGLHGMSDLSFSASKKKKSKKNSM